MPVHVAPGIRAREEALEAAGLLVPQTSVALTIATASESAGSTVKIIPNVTYQFNGHSYKSNGH